MKVRLIKNAVRMELLSRIPEMIEEYRSGDFRHIEADASNHIELDLEINENKLHLIDCSNNDHREVKNCMLMYEAMGSLPLHIARDNRLWEYITLTLLLKYTRKRWPIPNNEIKAVKHIKNHFFVVGARGFERDNSAARLWWMAYICSRIKGLGLEKALKCLLYQYDVRANIIERPTMSQSVNVFSEIIRILNESLESDKALFERKRFRSAMRRLNQIGGVKLLEAMDEADINTIIKSCFSIE
ncbi:MAG: DUF6339 family protein [Dethiobacteria bacterium]|jgi:hypothetical protein